jgi:hypothetical protein
MKRYVLGLAATLYAIGILETPGDGGLPPLTEAKAIFELVNET